MEKLTESFREAFAVSDFKEYYKLRSKIKDQEERRRELLQIQKKKRSEQFNRARGLEVDENAEYAEFQDEAMDCSATKATRSRQKRLYRNQLMLSEWLLEIPRDLDTNWYVVPCPVGRRMLVVSNRRGTRAFNKKGYPCAAFKSKLPEGLTMLDCIWCNDQHKYFVLDVLCWNNQTFLECETEFRHYWLESKMLEQPDVTERTSENPFPFSVLPYRPCTTEALSELLGGAEPPGGTLDGLLLYHRETHYTAGPTPLVGWLKPHMVPEVLGVDVHPRYAEERPSDYSDAQSYVRTLADAKHNKKKNIACKTKRRSRQSKMETDQIPNESSPNDSFVSDEAAARTTQETETSCMNIADESNDSNISIDNCDNLSEENKCAADVMIENTNNIADIT